MLRHPDPEILCHCSMETVAGLPRDVEGVVDPAAWNALAPKPAAADGVSQQASFQRTSFRQARCVVSTPADVERYAGTGTQAFLVPGEFCRQGDLLAAIAGVAEADVVLERGSFLSPVDVLRAVDKLAGAARTRILDAGICLGYADRVLDVRALGLYRRAGIAFGVDLSELTQTGTSSYAWRPSWLDDPAFLEDLVQAACTLGASFLAIRAEGPGAVTLDSLRAILRAREGGRL